MLNNIANALTLSRILVIPIIVLLIYMKGPFSCWLAFFLFSLASITDYFDGYFARIRKEVSNLGIFLDPIADKLLVSSVILILTSKGIISNFEIRTLTTNINICVFWDKKIYQFHIFIIFKFLVDLVIAEEIGLIFCFPSISC